LDWAELMKKRGLPLIFTIGHSTHSIGEFILLLQAHGVKRVADVRTIPRSRFNPQFNGDALAQSLRDVGIAYSHIPELGGLRRARKDSMNLGWRNASFRGFADYMETPEFAAGLAELTRLAAKQRVAMMCAEAVPWRCHRSLVADALTVRGYPVEDIMGLGPATRHRMTPFAQVRGTTVTYPAEKEQRLRKVERVKEAKAMKAGRAERRELVQELMGI
jgi:uncharacterized protein (DUF488 family)